jgi:hypothetical protein
MPDPSRSGGNAPQVASQMQNQRLAGGGAPVTSPQQLPQGPSMGAGPGPAQSVGDKLADVFQQITAEGFTPQVESALEAFFMSLQQLAPGAQGQGMQQQSPQPQPQGQAVPQFQQGGNSALAIPQPPPR